MRLTLALLLLFGLVSPVFAQYNIYANDGAYLGKPGDKTDPNPIHHPYGQYGSRFSPQSVHNPYGAYGSTFSGVSPNNPYTPPKPKYQATATQVDPMTAIHTADTDSPA